ncbi:hypothetical protein DFS34DRAFT_605962 [Phlyctochytrium arcticum]|nr:hypothetical protein DFS34DRAFT_605962 [Phlyctochytrium arcticum]
MSREVSDSTTVSYLANKVATLEADNQHIGHHLMQMQDILSGVSSDNQSLGWKLHLMKKEVKNIEHRMEQLEAENRQFRARVQARKNVDLIKITYLSKKVSNLEENNRHMGCRIMQMQDGLEGLTSENQKLGWELHHMKTELQRTLHNYHQIG